MKKEYLDKIKKKVSLLTDEEKILRDLYLKGIASGEIQGPMVDHPEVSKPFLKYHTGLYTEPKVKKTVYQELHDNNLDQPNAIALEFFGAKITFRELDENIVKCSKSLEELGVKEGDYVTIISAGIPETVYSFYALSKLGAAANMMAPYFDKDGLVNRINDCKSDIAIVMDTFYPEVIDSLNRSRIKKIIVVPTLNSSPLKIISKKPKVKENEMLWNDFIKLSKNRPYSTTVNYKPNMPLVMVYSSATTGASKCILLSNDSFLNSVNAYKVSGVKVGRGYKFYQIIPPWYSTGISTSINLILACGSTVFMDPRFDREVFIKNIIKHKPNYSVAPTSMYEGFLEDRLVKNHDLSYFMYPFQGGEPLRLEIADAIETVFRAHGLDANMLSGYGQCEGGATIASETPYTNHIGGNVGVPLPGINIAIVDESLNSLPFNMRGQIIADTPCGMLEYYNNPEATSKYFYYDEFGTKWYCTGDIGHVDTDGNIYVEGRGSDYSIVNGTKVYNFDVENAIMKDPNIQLCDVIMNNGLLTAHLVFKENFNKAHIDEELAYLQDLIYDTVQDEKLVPYSFKVRDSFPFAKSGKRNITEMQNETDGFIYLNKYENHEKRLLRK